MVGSEAGVTAGAAVGVTVDHILHGGMAVALVVRKGFLQRGMAVALVMRKADQEALATAAALGGVLHLPRGETAAPSQMA